MFSGSRATAICVNGVRSGSKPHEADITSRESYRRVRTRSLGSWYSTESGDYKAANAAARAVASAHRELVKLGAQESLVGLLNEADRGVRLWAASHALSLLPAEAERVLAELAQEPRGLIAVSAEVALREWRKTLS
jgi:hypothetical protein